MSDLLLPRIRKKITNHLQEKDQFLIGKKYYDNENDIVHHGVTVKNTETDKVLRNADNRIPHNHHQVLVDEKTSYMFTYPPLLNINNDPDITTRINNVLGDGFTHRLKNLCIEASNCGVSYLHYWISDDNTFKYELVNSEEIIPQYDNGLERKIQSIIRYYHVWEEVEGLLDDQLYCYVEYWTKDKLIRWKFIDSYYGSKVDSAYEEISHNLKEVPFIEFRNNKNKKSDLVKIKNLIDLSDKVMSGYANDIEDITQCIYILENYGGENLGEFLSDLKRYNAVKTDDNGGLKTMTIDIPVEARKVLIDILTDLIVEAGQGLQRVENLNSDSSLALRFFYRRLELKCGLLESEFSVGIKVLVKAILRFLKLDDNVRITQTWTRNMISSDLENAQIAQMSVGIISSKTIIENHPWVNDPLKEIKQLEKESIIDDEYSDLGDTDE